MKLDLTPLMKSIQALQKSLSVYESHTQKSVIDEELTETVRAGVIKNFEIAYELSWKFMKRWLSYNVGSEYVDGVPRKELFRIAAENKLISNTEAWFLFHKSRNLTSHVYDEETAEEVFSQSKKFLTYAQEYFSELEKKNG